MDNYIQTSIKLLSDGVAVNELVLQTYEWTIFASSISVKSSESNGDPPQCQRPPQDTWPYAVRDYQPLINHYDPLRALIKALFSWRGGWHWVGTLRFLWWTKGTLPKYLRLQGCFCTREILKVLFGVTLYHGKSSCSTHFFGGIRRCFSFSKHLNTSKSKFKDGEILCINMTWSMMVHTSFNWIWSWILHSSTWVHRVYSFLSA